ncbi:hypothetical protein C461_03103 [Halorubrum aidingense JCM 13560]|uniref:Uncharacterized protein n=1 Tax=Halorubrum aidingense JCM 13560 TaxID=1230454 RepID=M0PKN1_9EURY|nr:hypothetical protein [Halorubrum aidingense]EMA69315.1 hypothetical protein C461_03103 [Halorubrum aidingense JCM 13560]
MSDDTIRVRVDRGDYRHEREHYTRGDEIDVDPKVLEKHPNSLTRVEELDESADDSGTDATDDSDDEIVVDPDPSELTVHELRDRIADVDDADLLGAIKDAEEEGKNRETATDALDERIAELEG